MAQNKLSGSGKRGWRRRLALRGRADMAHHRAWPAWRPGPIPARFGSNGVKTFQPVYSNRAEEVAVRKVLAQESMAFHSCAMKVYIVN